MIAGKMEKHKPATSYISSWVNKTVTTTNPKSTLITIPHPKGTP